jgi:hypothetical protein
MRGPIEAFQNLFHKKGGAMLANQKKLLIFYGYPVETRRDDLF